MIRRIFWDLDDVLCKTAHSPPPCKHIEFSLGGWDSKYYTVIRPLARELLDYSKSLVGEENTYILTNSVQAYAESICALGELGIEPSRIIGREALNKYYYGDSKPEQYGGAYKPHELASPHNALLDDLPHTHPRTFKKLTLLGLVSSPVRARHRNFYQMKPWHHLETGVDETAIRAREWLDKTHQLP
jgi:hypothetical protein